MPKFDFNSEEIEVKWIVESVLPLGQLVFFLAQAGVGKSLLVEDLATHMVNEVPFCGFNTLYGDVLIIDQDTNEPDLKRRLQAFHRALGTTKKHEIYVEPFGEDKEYLLSNKTLYTCIRDHPTVKLVIIDTLNAVCGSLNPNSNADMNSAFAKLKAQCLRPDLTIAINHHITEKMEYTTEQLMTESPHKMSMGASAINQRADTYYVVSADAEDGMTKWIYLRPISKRASIKSAPLVLQMLFPESGGERLDFHSYYDTKHNECEKDCLALFNGHNRDRKFLEIYNDMGQMHSQQDVRKALKKLHKEGLLHKSIHDHNMFTYRLP